VTKLKSKFLKEMTKKEILVPHLNRWFAAGVFPDEMPMAIYPNKKGDTAFHPSSDATGCLRYLYAKHKGHLEPQRLTSEMQKTFQIGHMYHAWLQYILVEGLGFSTWKEIEKKYSKKLVTDKGNKWSVSGSADVASCKIPGQSKPYLIDIKTMRSTSFSQAKMPEWLWEKYEAQAQVYMEWHNKDATILLCCNKDSPHQFKEYIIYRKFDKVSDIYNRWEKLADHLADDIPPDCDCHSPKCEVVDLYVESGTSG
jgi:hypothetical protein